MAHRERGEIRSLTYNLFRLVRDDEGICQDQCNFNELSKNTEGRRLVGSWVNLESLRR